MRPHGKLELEQQLVRRQTLGVEECLRALTSLGKLAVRIFGVRCVETRDRLLEAFADSHRGEEIIAGPTTSGTLRKVTQLCVLTAHKMLPLDFNWYFSNVSY